MHVKAGVLNWFESKSSWNHPFINVAKKEIQQIIHDNIHGLRWDFPDSDAKGGTTTSGNTARDVLHNAGNREVILSELDNQELKETLSVHGRQLSLILRVLSSKVVDIEQYKAFCIYRIIPLSS